jgi:hypothetical protein
LKRLFLDAADPRQCVRRLVQQRREDRRGAAAQALAADHQLVDVDVIASRGLPALGGEVAEDEPAAAVAAALVDDDRDGRQLVVTLHDLGPRAFQRLDESGSTL